MTIKASTWIQIAAGLLLFCLSACNDREAQQDKEREVYRTLLEMEAPLPIDERPKILVLHNYDPEDSRLQEIKRGILRGFSEEGYKPYKNLTIDFLPVQSVKESAGMKQQDAVERARERINAWRPDVVLAAGNILDQYKATEMRNTETKFVIFAVDDNLESKFEKLTKNAKGAIGVILERAHIERTIRLLRYLAPEVQKIAVISDNSENGILVTKRLLDMAVDLDVEVVSSSIVERVDQWKSFVVSVQNKADALLVASYNEIEDNQGHHVPGKAVIDWTIGHSSLPDAGFEAEAVRDGLMGSEAVSAYGQGFLAATIASYALMGQSPDDFPVQSPRHGELHINSDRTAVLEIEIPEELQRIAVQHSSSGRLEDTGFRH